MTPKERTQRILDEFFWGVGVQAERKTLRPIVELHIKEAIAEAEARAEENHRAAQIHEANWLKTGALLLKTKAQAETLRAALEAVEWEPSGDGWVQCPWCDGYKERGHKPTCQRQAALQGEGKESGWRPIETAPKDGTLILLYPTKGEGRISTGYWWKPENGDYCWAAGGGWFEEDEVSHWTPLPELPRAATPAQE